MAKKTELADTKADAKAAATEEQAKLKAVMKSIEKDYGEGAVQQLGNVASGVIRKGPMIPSGSIGLDLALGNMYRLPDGRWMTGYSRAAIIEIFGDEGTGKTTLLGQLIANAQAMGVRCAVGDMEHTWDPPYMHRLGVDLDKLYFYQPKSGTECLEINERLLKSGLFGLIATDSVASLVTQAELDGEVTDSHVGEQSRMMSQFLRIANTYLTQGAQCNLVFTNQMRDKIGGFGGKTTPGGRALKFYASNRIEMYKAATLAENEVKYGQKVHATVIKNKSSAPFRFGEFDLVWGQGIDYIAELFDLCVARGLIVGAGAWFSIGGKSFGQGRRNCCDNLRGNPALCYQLYDAMMTGALAERGLTPEGELIPNFQDPTPPMGTVATAFAPVPGAPAELKQAA